jgi:hypothetical protein
MNGHLRKPVSEDTLMETLCEYLMPVVNGGGWHTYMPDFDVDQAMQKLRGNKILYAKMLTKLRENTQFGELREALDAGDAEATGALAAGLSGVAKNLCLSDISGLLIKIITMAKSRRVPKEFSGQFGRMCEGMFGKLDGLIEALEEQ